MKTVLWIYAAILGTASLIAFVTYGVDKAKAMREGDRISERVLLALAVYGGAVGAFFGRTVFRPKTKKNYFTLVIPTALLLQVGVFVLLISKGGAQ